MAGIFLPGNAKGSSGDITGVTAGTGLSGGGSSGGVTLTLDLSELSAVTPVNGDSLATLDSDGANEQLTTVAALATLFSGDGLAASSSVMGVDLVSNGGLEISSNKLQVATGISQYDVAQFAASVVDNDFLRIDGTAVEGLSAAEVAAAIESSIDAVGTIATGTWEGTTIAVDQGGTGATSLNNLITLSTHTTGNYVATITGGTGITSTGATSGEGIAHSLSVDASQAITALTGGDLTIYDDQNNADVSLKMGTSATESLTIQVLNGGSNKTAEEIHFSTATASGTADHGKMVFDVDGTDIVTIDDGGLNVGSGSLETATIDYTDGDNAITIADGGGITFAQDVSTTDGKWIKLGGSTMATAEPGSSSSGYGIVIGIDSAGSIAAGDAVAINSSGKAIQANAATGSVTEPAIGIATNAAGSDGDDCFVLTHGIWRMDAEAFDAGDPVYVGESAGAITKTAPSDDGDFVQRIGIAVTDDVLLVMPSTDQIEVA